MKFHNLRIKKRTSLRLRSVSTKAQLRLDGLMNKANFDQARPTLPQAKIETALTMLYPFQSRTYRWIDPQRIIKLQRQHPALE